MPSGAGNLLATRSQDDPVSGGLKAAAFWLEVAGDDGQEVG
jgi:hypothetical protein